ncbi:MAG: hypothetical protein COU07_03055 [Candidatus Harrisonbacteria bacterium CG10_big_fil_rev_8_21_14_0_10_40_38]|uniref:Bacterial sugar transferase domain-containing protein n=1 Tax=Candidatus Harrisonbacteria bacterium CG10_big_fil_rev_8_21_14_0_10_40_38 TaxID=1974583 RepID=A0A2H0UTD8_9BACT|nr:MAG: hypothetical protein COU07_03055 [Candidatus Harrisonbacteria bacterium CG10_big_fil_rev_8_21_14_0_10_40_38]
MIHSPKIKQFLLFLGDIAILYVSLILTLIVRYGTLSPFGADHFAPFSIVFVFWLLIFYISGFYELRDLRNDKEFRKRFLAGLAVSFLLAIAFFYFAPGFEITPKTNLFLFLVLFGSLAHWWRTVVNTLMSSGSSHKRILLVGTSATTKETFDYLSTHPQLGYEVRHWIKNDADILDSKNLFEIIKSEKINLIVVPAHLKKDSKTTKLLYIYLGSGIEVIDLATLYGFLFQRVPIAELEEVWFLENLAIDRSFHDAVQRPFEIILSLILGTIFLPLGVLLIILIKATSSGSAFFTQTRIGKHGRKFTLWKFRTMPIDAEQNGPAWSGPNDRRPTKIGKILRQTHLDELPQLWNILKGDLSLVGPRPERPEFTEVLSKEIPFFELRNLVRPGLTGWAQINYRYGSSTSDSYKKLEYDIFYLKNRSIMLDLIILVRTIKRLFIPAR